MGGVVIVFLFVCFAVLVTGFLVMSMVQLNLDGAVML